MMSLLKKYIIFPWMIAAYPVLALLAHNLGQIGVGDAVRPLMLVLSFSAVFLGVSLWIWKDWGKAGLATSLIFILFFSYGRLYPILEVISIAGVNLGHHHTLIPIYLLTFILGLYLINRVGRVSEAWFVFLNTLSTTMVLLTLIQIGSYQWNRWQAQTQALEGTPSLTEHFGAYVPEDLPDIYFIILDEYARQDVLENVFGINNHDFEAFLSQQGFQVLSESRTNYAQTELALSADLNLNYLQSLDPSLDPEEDDRSELWDWILHSQVVRALDEVGYQIVAFATGFHWSELRSADDFRLPPMSILDQLRTAGVTSAFEGVLMHNSAGLILSDALTKYQADVDYPYRMHRQRILYTLDQLETDVPSMAGPKFVFAHLIAPHGPPVLGPNGESEVNPDLDQAYLDEIVFLNNRLQDVITSILEQSDGEAVIVLQSDTGPPVHLDWDHPSCETLWARMTIFYAIYLPPEYRIELPQDMSAVNTFRVVFNQLFSADFPLLADRSYFTNWDRPYDFVDVTDEVQSYPCASSLEVP